jgi:uncharacterized FlgJ-related protein
METVNMEPFKRLLYGFSGICFGLVVSLVILKRPEAPAAKIKRVAQAEIIKPVDPSFSKERLLETLKDMRVKYYDIVYAQAIVETGRFTSNIFRNGNNLFGMKLARQRPTTAIGEYKGHAKYRSWEHSVMDYALFQAAYTKKCKTREEYLQYLKRNYAGDPDYVNKVRQIANKIS